MIVWIASYSRSGNTFFRVVMHQLYGINSYVAFRASEGLNWAGAGDLVGYQPLPDALKNALQSGERDRIREALRELDEREELFFFKTHAWASELYDTNYRAILVARDGRDALASYANYLIDVQFNETRLRAALRRGPRSKGDLLRIGRILGVAGAKRLGLRRWMISALLNRLLRADDRSWWNWSTMNQSWLDRARKPVIVRFSDLVRDPIGAVTDAVDKLGVGLVPISGASIPSFVQLKEQFPNFFRKGTSGDWRTYFSPTQERMFRLRHQDTMEKLGFELDR